MRTALSLLLCCSLATPVGAQDCARDAMLVMDGSASMAELGPDPRAPTRIEDARTALSRAMPRIAPVRRVGLLVYGPGGTDACNSISLRFKPVPDAAGPVLRAVEALSPGGMTPLTASVEAAAAVLEGHGIVVLVTDGNETCGGRPCALGAGLAAAAPGLTVHVIGFRVVRDPFSWNNPEGRDYTEGETVAKCLADRTGGLFLSTDTVDELAAAMQQVLGCALIGQAPSRERREGRV